MTEPDPREMLRPYEPLLGSWSLEMTHPAFPGLVIRGSARFEWVPGERFLTQRAENDHPDFPDSLSVIGIMEGDRDLAMQYFDSRGVHRLYRVAFEERELQIWRDEPGFAQRLSAKLDAAGMTLSGVWQLNEANKGFRDDLAITYRRI